MRSSQLPQAHLHSSILWHVLHQALIRPLSCVLLLTQAWHCLCLLVQRNTDQLVLCAISLAHGLSISMENETLCLCLWWRRNNARVCISGPIFVCGRFWHVNIRSVFALVLNPKSSGLDYKGGSSASVQGHHPIVTTSPLTIGMSSPARRKLSTSQLTSMIGFKVCQSSQLGQCYLIDCCKISCLSGGGGS